MKKTHYMIMALTVFAAAAGISGCKKETVTETSAAAVKVSEAETTEAETTEAETTTAQAATSPVSESPTAAIDESSVESMHSILQALMLTDYYADRPYNADDMEYVSQAVYTVFNSNGLMESRGITITEDGFMRIPKQAVQEVVNAMFASPVDIAEKYEAGFSSTWLSYDPSWEAFTMMPADGELTWCQIESWKDLGNGSCEAEIRMLEGENDITLGYSTAVLVPNKDAEFISEPLYPFTVQSFSTAINGRDVALGYPQEDGAVENAGEPETWYGIFGGTIDPVTVEVTVEGTEDVYTAENDSVMKKFYEIAPGTPILIDVEIRDGEKIITDVILG